MDRSKRMSDIDRENSSQKYWDSQTFASLLPVLYALIVGGIIISVYPVKFQVIYFMISWIIAALSVLRIQQLIQHYSQGKYHYQTSTCVVVLASVLLAPWLWLYVMAILFDALVNCGLVANNHASWVATFTLGATGISLVAVTPIIESWYEILRGSFSFDGTRIKVFRPSLKAQMLLFALFAGILLAPATLIGTHPAYALNKDDTTYLFTGFCSTFVAMIWLVEQLERIRRIQVSIYHSSHAPVDQSLLTRTGPLRNNIGPGSRVGHGALMSSKNQSFYAGAYTAQGNGPTRSLASSFRSLKSTG
jgi:hypothetical protein